MLKALKETVRCVNEPSLEYGNEKSFSFTDAWTKRNGKAFTEKKTIICAYLSAIH